MTLRSVHRTCGLIAAPLMILTAVCGLLLLFRKTGLYDRSGEFREAVEHLHNYEILAPYVGSVAAVLMVLVALTGLVLRWQVRVRKRKA